MFVPEENEEITNEEAYDEYDFRQEADFYDEELEGGAW